MVPVERSWILPFSWLLLFSSWFAPAASVKHENYKTCSQSGFCSRNRGFADEVTNKGTTWASPYALDAASLRFKDGSLSGNILKTISAASGETVNLPITIAFLESGVARVTIDEEKRQKGDIQLRHDSKAKKERYNEASKWSLVGGLNPNKKAEMTSAGGGTTKVSFGPNGEHEVIITHKPFSLDFKRGGETQMKINDRGFMNVEHWRPKVDAPEPPAGEKTDGEDTPEVTQEAVAKNGDEDTWWEEMFGGNTDSKPRGPESIGLDVTFPGYEYVYGIPEHTGPLALKETRGGEGKYDEPYRLYNLDVFEYIMDSPMALYGAIPLMQAHKKNSTVGFFWLNGAETWVDIVKSKNLANPLSMGIGSTTNTQTHWMSESGILDFFVLLGPKPEDISKTYGELTGYSYLPPEFAIAYHQCRWNYVTDEDVKDVDRRFDKFDIPYDVIWLDIEYADGKAYFTWDPLTFSNPLGMMNHLEVHKRKLVAIIDPHIKKRDNYEIISELEKKNLATKDKNGELFEGWCWPGSSRWVDCFDPAAITWWKGLFKYDKFKGTTASTWIWNDMNEPSVFNGPETTMPKDNLHHGNWEHRDVHNINGMTFHTATFQALLERDSAKKAIDRKRPFVLTRSFFPGSQRTAAMWTGDNLAEWSHLAASIPMILNQGISGFPFAGADVGGFFGNPDKELLTRWYQTGVFYPFFRAHAHIDTRRREPYLIGDPYTPIITKTIRLRYQLLPAWYTAFYQTSITGKPVVRPVWYAYPGEEKAFAIEDQMYLADTGLLVKPVTAEGQTSVDMYIPDAATYYDYFDYTIYSGKASRTHTIPAPLERLPLLMQAGHIIPRRDRPRRSSGLMKWDPFTLLITLDSQITSAVGELFFDDGESYAFTEGTYVYRRFVLQDGILTNEDLMPAANRTKQTTAYLKSIEDVVVEKILVVGAPDAWKDLKAVQISEDGGSTKSEDLSFVPSEGGHAAYAIVRTPNVRVGAGWRIAFR